VKTREELKEIKRIKTLKRITFLAINSTLIFTTVGLLSLAPINLNNNVNVDFVKANQLIKHSNEYIVKCEYKSNIEIDKTKSIVLQAPNKVVVESKIKNGISIRQEVKVVSRGDFRHKVTDEEYIMLCRISASETTEGSLKQKMNVVSTVISRIENYGSIEKAIFAKRQYSVIGDGRFYSQEITELDKQAVDKVLKNGVTHNLIYFKAKWCDSSWFDRDLKFIFSDGLHDFYDVK
jgi:hypothetical protein